jgi:hypothetical protein
MNENEPWRLQRFLWLWGCCFQYWIGLLFCKTKNFQRFAVIDAALLFLTALLIRQDFSSQLLLCPLSLQVSKIGGGLFVDFSCGCLSMLPFF